MPELPQVLEPLTTHVEILISNVDKKTSAGERPVRLCNYMDAYTTPYLDGTHTYMIATATPREIHRFRLRKGDVVITKDSETPDDIGIATVIDDAEGSPPLVCGYHLAILRTSTMDPVFLAKQLGHDRVKAYFGAMATGSTRYGLSAGALNAVPLFVPSRPAQERIGQILRTIDDAVRLSEAVIAKLENVKRGLVHNLLTCGIDDNGEVRDPDHNPDIFKTSPVGRVPVSWTIGSVDAAFDISSGITLGPHRRPRNWAHPYLRVGNVFRDHLDLTNVATLEARPAEVAAKCLVVGDILVVEGHANPNEIGRAAIATSEVAGFLFQNHLFRLRPRRLLPEFAIQWMNSAHVRAYWRRYSASSSGLNTINQQILRNVPTAEPPEPEQRRIVDACNAIAQSLDEAGRDLAKLRLLKKGIADDLLMGRVRVGVAAG